MFIRSMPCLWVCQPVNFKKFLLNFVELIEEPQRQPSALEDGLAAARLQLSVSKVLERACGIRYQ